MAVLWKIFQVVAFILPLTCLYFTYRHISTVVTKANVEQTLNPTNVSSLDCRANYFPMNGSCVTCPVGEFSMAGWLGCMSWLNCDNISHDVSTRRRLGKPGHLNAVKEVYLADWFGYDVVYSTCAYDIYSEDCLHGLNMVEGLQGTQYIIQLIGICYHSLEMVTAYHPHGSAEDLDLLLQTPELVKYDTLQTRFQLSLDYVSIMYFLHNSPLGTRVMCDANDIDKTLSQYLISKDFHLVLNDVDALPQVDHKQQKYIKCGKRQLAGSFVAPEQLWPFRDKEFNDDDMPGYDEKIDIWRIPCVLDKLLARVNNANYIRRLLLPLHERCRYNEPQSRPSAAEVLEEYHKVFNIIRTGFKDEI